MSKLHDALHAAREQIRQIGLDGIVFEDNVNRAQHGIANSLSDVGRREDWHAFLFDARRGLELALDAKTGPAEALRLAHRAEDNVATVLGDLHFSAPCDR